MQDKGFTAQPISKYQSTAQILILVGVIVLAYATRTIWFDQLRSNQLKVEITGPVELLANPYPKEISRNTVLATLDKGDKVHVLKTVTSGSYIALKVRTESKKTGYILKGGNFTIH
jgi:hypothetical protein